MATTGAGADASGKGPIRPHAELHQLSLDRIHHLRPYPLRAARTLREHEERVRILERRLVLAKARSHRSCARARR